MGIFDKAKESVAAVKEKALGKMTDLKDAGSEKINQLLEDFESAKPHLKKAGFTLIELSVDIGINPVVTPYFKCEEVKQETIDQVFSEIESNKIGKNILNMLIKASQMQQKIKIQSMQFSGIAVEVGVIPKVQIKYNIKYQWIILQFFIQNFR